MASADELPVEATKRQSLFREVNERVREFARDSPPTQYLCECADPLCTGLVVLAPGAYDSVRRFPTRFVVMPGHHDQPQERVLETNLGYAVVEKYGLSGTVAVRLDPRRRELLADIAGEQR